MKYWHTQIGSTLVETMLALVLTALLASLLMAGYWSSSQSFNRTISISEMQYTAREARQMILKDIYSCERAEIFGSDGKPSDFGEAGSRLRLIIPIMLETGMEYRAVSYYVANNTLYRTRFMLSDVQNSEEEQFLDKIPIADHVSELSFSSSTAGVVEYELLCNWGIAAFEIQGTASSRMHYSIGGK